MLMRRKTRDVVPEEAGEMTAANVTILASPCLPAPVL
jgi:hypothetical protein